MTQRFKECNGAKQGNRLIRIELINFTNLAKLLLAREAFYEKGCQEKNLSYLGDQIICLTAKVGEVFLLTSIFLERFAR